MAKQYKLKSKKGAVKRFKVTRGGLRRRKANRNHILTKKSQKRKRHLRSNDSVKKCDENAIQRLLVGS